MEESFAQSKASELLVVPEWICLPSSVEKFKVYPGLFAME